MFVLLQLYNILNFSSLVLFFVYSWKSHCDFDSRSLNATIKIEEILLKCSY